MKKIYTFLLLLLAFSMSAVAQNQYWNYYSQNFTTNPTSTVSIVHSNGNVYYFQADKNNSFMSVTEINPISMLPTGVIKGYYGTSDITLEGGFEDVSGNFVLYGYRDMGNNSWYPFYMIIEQNYSFYFYWHNPNPIGRFVKGCSGYDINNNPTYLFVMDDGKLFVAEPRSLVNNHLITQGDGYPYQDVSWDTIHQKFIVTGSHPILQGQYSPGPFVENMRLDLSLTPNPILSPFFHYNISDQTILGCEEDRTMHAQIDDDHLVVYHDLRRGNSDILWLTLVRNYHSVNPYIINSRHFSIPAQKLFALDMVYDTKNYRLNLLTKLIYCNFDKWPLQLSQVNPYTLTGMNTVQLDGGYTAYPPCPSMEDPNIFIYGTKLKTNRMSFNYHNPIGSVLVSGVDYSATAVLTETYDVSASACDIPLAISEHNATTFLNSYYSTSSSTSVSMSDFHQGFLNDQISANILCLDPNAYSNLRANQSPKALSTETLIKPDVLILDNHRFLCTGFEGETTVCLYDLMGKTVWMTKVKPDIQNFLPNLHGVYIIRAIDNSAHYAVSKIFLP